MVDAQRVVVLSDVHGVLPVLEAVLAEPDVAGADLVVVTGDHTAGPMPVETLDALTSLGDRIVLVRGNADREAVAIRSGADSAHPESLWAAHALREDQIAVLAGLPHPVTVDIAGFGPVLFCHGSPRDDDEVVLVDSPVPAWQNALSTVPDEVGTVACGHTHMPFVRLVDRRLVLNPGSVGMPYGRTGGAWALLDHGQVSLRHTEIDVDAVCARIIAESEYPDRAAWADEYVRSRNSDLDALTAFTPRVGNPSTA
ncbi:MULTISPECIES: metallophosphoesterase family protein [unclassified Knoellia]|uniref:metallophosphoesterase family protein n=1 Tax=Knoellia altitudinis TaxID=3404795 RepID=UPI00362331DA